MIYNRKTKQLENEISYQEKTLNFLYNTVLGRFFLSLFIARPWFSKLRGMYQKSKFSKKDIIPFIKKYNIDCSEYDINEFENFNDFFIRKKTLKIKDDEPQNLISPADSKLSVYEIKDELKIQCKGSVYNIQDILQDEHLTKEFNKGWCLVFRLGVNDYHRYHFIDNGKLLYNKKIKGELHTVRPIAYSHKIFKRNSREVNIIETENFGKIAYIEVGALLVGKIKNHQNKTNHKKYDEKGYFEFGGSTIILLINKDLKFDDDIVEFTQQGYEIKVSAGEKIAVLKEE